MKSQLRIVSNKLAKLGHLKSNKAEVLLIEEVKKIHPFLPHAFGANSRAVASRARKLGLSLVFWSRLRLIFKQSTLLVSPPRVVGRFVDTRD